MGFLTILTCKMVQLSETYAFRFLHSISYIKKSISIQNYYICYRPNYYPL